MRNSPDYFYGRKCKRSVERQSDQTYSGEKVNNSDRHGQDEDEEPNYNREAIIRDLCLGKFLTFSLDELEKTLSEFLDYQRLNKDNLLETGLRKFLFKPSGYLDHGLSNLYCTRLPGKVEGLVREGQMEFHYQWWEHWPVKLAPHFHPVSPFVSGRLVYEREIDTDWLQDWFPLPKLPVLSENHSLAVPAPFLKPSDVERIERERGLLFELKEAILVEVCRALKNRDSSMLWNRSIEVLNVKNISRDFIRFYVELEWMYRLMIGRPSLLNDLVMDKLTGGLSSLFLLVCHVEQELKEPEWEQIARVWGAVADVFESKGLRLWGSDYAECVTVVGVDVINDVADWIYYLTWNSAHELTRIMTADLKVEVADIVLTRPEFQDNVRQKLHDFDSVIATYARNPEGKDLIISLIERGSGDTQSQNVLRKDGEYWEFRYSGEETKLKDCKGLKYLAILLRAPGENLPATLLVDTVSGGPPTISQDVQTFRSTEIGIELSDAQTVDQVRRRLRQIGTERAEAVEADDFESIKKLDEEVEKLGQYLGATTSKSRTIRTSGTRADKDRKSVSGAINDVLRKIEKTHKPLFKHLKASVQTGYRCGYNPSEPTPWHVVT